MPISLTSEHSERLLELVVRLSNRLDDPMLWEDVVCSTTSMCGFEGGALLLPDGRGGWRRAAAIALQPGDERYLDALTPEEVGRRAAAPAAVHGDRVVVVPCASAAGRVEAALVLFGLRPGRSADAALLQQLGRVLGPIIGVVCATASAREVAAAVAEVCPRVSSTELVLFTMWREPGGDVIRVQHRDVGAGMELQDVGGVPGQLAAARVGHDELGARPHHGGDGILEIDDGRQRRLQHHVGQPGRIGSVG